MRNLFRCHTTAGVFYIAEYQGRFHPVYAGESPGSYARPEQAAEDLAGGTHSRRANGIDTARLDIPEDFSEWERL